MEEKVFSLSGKLNELSSFDFQALESLNSSGLRNWIVGLDASSSKVIYRNCPVFLVSQFVMIPDLVRDVVYIESFEMPFVCYDCNQENSKFVHLEECLDPAKFDPDEIDPPKCQNCKKSMEPDDEEIETYDFFADMGQKP